MPQTSDRQRIEIVCSRIAEGRRLVRQLASALHNFPLTESEFRLLWLLWERSTRDAGASVEQKKLATELGISAAQVSSIVETLRGKQAIVSVSNARDRRQRLWRLSTDGRDSFEGVAAAVGIFSRGWKLPELDVVGSSSPQEHAA